MNILIRYTVGDYPFTVVAPNSARWSDWECMHYVATIHQSAVVTSIERCEFVPKVWGGRYLDHS